MRKILIAGIIFHAAIANAMDIAYLTKKHHFPIMKLEITAGDFCRTSFGLSNSNGASRYKECVEEKKKEFSNDFIEANKYLKSKGNAYNDAVLSLRKYYNSVLEMLSIPEGFSSESRYEQNLRRSRQQTLESVIHAAWQELETDIKIADQ